MPRRTSCDRPAPRRPVTWNIAAGARVAAPGSLAIDAAGAARSFGQIAADGAAVSLGSGRIVLAADQAAVERRAGAEQRRARRLQRQCASCASSAGSASTSRLPVVVGAQDGGEDGAMAARLILDSPLLAGAGASASLEANEVVLRNSGAAGTAAPPAGREVAASQILADRLRWMAARVAIEGFGDTAAGGPERSRWRLARAAWGRAAT